MNYALSTVFCDDIRIENNGKLILIGVYQEDLIPAFLPQTLGLSFWARLEGVEKGVQEVTLNIGVNDAAQHKLNIKLDIQAEGKPAHIHIIGLPVQIESPSRIFIEVAGLPIPNTLRSFLDVRPVQSTSEMPS